eukprot:6181351-Pleurochrysis_carterae.AAC.8
MGPCLHAEAPVRAIDVDIRTRMAALIFVREHEHARDSCAGACATCACACSRVCTPMRGVPESVRAYTVLRLIASHVTRTCS